MRLFISKTTNALVQGVNQLSPVNSAPVIKLATDEPLEIQYINADGAAEKLPAGKQPFLCIKEISHYDDAPAVQSAPLASPTTDAGFYTGILDCSTPKFAALLGNTPGSPNAEKDTVTLMGEVVYPSDVVGKLVRSQTFSIIGLNRVVTDGDALSTGVTPSLRVARVESNGNDASGSVGGAPFATAQAAYNVILAARATAGSGSYKLQLGVGPWNITLNATTGWPDWLGVGGAGVGICTLTLTGAGAGGQDAPPIYLCGDATFALALNVTGGNAATATGSGGNVLAYVQGCAISSASLTGGVGGLVSGDGGNVDLTLVDCPRADDTTSVTLSGGSCSSGIAGQVFLSAFGGSFVEVAVQPGTEDASGDTGTANVSLAMTRIEDILSLNGGAGSLALLDGGYINTIYGTADSGAALIKARKTAIEFTGLTNWTYDQL